jgi:hypothetical protein
LGCYRNKTAWRPLTQDGSFIPRLPLQSSALWSFTTRGRAKASEAGELQKSFHHLIFVEVWIATFAKSRDDTGDLLGRRSGLGVALKFHPQIEAVLDKGNVVAALAADVQTAGFSLFRKYPEPLTIHSELAFPSLSVTCAAA